MTDDIVVSREWLADNRDAVRVVDVRDAWEYDGIGHVPGAVNVPFDAFRNEDGGDVGMLPGAETFERHMREAGVAPEDTLVFYDDTHGVFAARVLVTALVYGHADVRLLDGDYSAWNREYGTTTEGPDYPASDYAVTDRGGDFLVDYDVVVDLLDDEDAVLVDTRDDWEYEEGHLPGAVNLDWKELVDDESRGLKPDDELRAILEGYGVVPERRVILYCNTARRISHTYVVLRHLGFADVAFYEGSLTEWHERDGPIETSE